jgi:hypothetical protein
MRFFFTGPRILGIRPGISFGASELLRLATKPKQDKPGEPMTGSFLYVIRGDQGLCYPVPPCRSVFDDRAIRNCSRFLPALSCACSQ